MKLIHQCRFAAIDFESAGATRGMTDSPVQIGLMSWSVDGGYGDSFASYLHTNRPIQWSAQKVHGISSVELDNAPTLISLWPELKKRLEGSIMVAHGKGTEKRFLRAFPGHGFGPWIDTLLLARSAWPDLPDHSLGSICDQLCLSNHVRALVPEKSWHDALFDAAASLVVLAHLIDSLDAARLPLSALGRDLYPLGPSA
jgi:DNA polymerase-3 subunit epsilon